MREQAADAAERPLRILLVDDEPMLRRALQRLLRQHELVCASTGRDALRQLEVDGRYDLVLCDLMMPEMDGPALYDAVCACASGLAERFVFMSGGAYTERMQTFVERHGERVLEKPISRGQLLRVLRAVVPDSA